MYKLVNGKMQKIETPKKPTVDNMRELTARIEELEAAAAEKDARIEELEAAAKKTASKTTGKAKTEEAAEPAE